MEAEDEGDLDFADDGHVEKKNKLGVKAHAETDLLQKKGPQ